MTAHADARVFTLEAVNASCPEALERREAAARASLGDRALCSHLGRELGDVPERIVLDPADPTDVREMKRDLVAKIEEYRAGWRDVEEMGAVLKDARSGLLDFYGKVDGKLVWLCWKYGEDAVRALPRARRRLRRAKPIGASVRRSACWN